MVNTVTATYFNDAASWEDIPQLEDGWYPTCGAVNPGADQGLMNWAPLRLARRTRWLRDRVELAGIGADAPSTVNLNTLGNTARFFSFLSTAVGAPNVGVAYDGVGEHIDGPAGKMQFVSCTTGRPFLFRMDDQNGSGWTAWQDVAVGQRQILAAGLATGGGDLLADRTITVPIASTAQAQAGTNNATAITPLRLAEAFTGTVASTGWTRLPNGLIMQWGAATFPSGTGIRSVVVTLPLTFPNAAYRAFACDNNDGDPAILGAQASTTQITVQGNEVASGVVDWWCIGS